jgi:phage N-6-adenine-methyltransferase
MSVTTITTASRTSLGYVGSVPGKATPGRDSDSWFTPTQYVTAARRALGGRIDLDPFSSDAANKVVKARVRWTAADDAFAQDWSNVPQGADGSVTVFMNPPYSAGLCGQAITRFVEEFESGNITRGIVLVNNATDTRWFATAMSAASAVCFTDHRIAFWNADGKAVSGNTRGQAFLYYCSDDSVPSFAQAFSQFGHVLQPARGF